MKLSRSGEDDVLGAETVVNDNGLGAGHEDDSAMTEVGGGSIVMHGK